MNWFEYKRRSKFTFLRPSGVLSYQSIRKVKPVVPLVERTIHKSGLTYGLGPATYDVRILNSIIIEPGDFCLISTLEKMLFPDDICGTVQDKSTWARKGLVVQNTHIDPGFIGGLTLELTHHGKDRLVLDSGTPIAQLKFEWLDFPTLRPYKGKYQYQQVAAQEAIFEEIK